MSNRPKKVAIAHRPAASGSPSPHHVDAWMNGSSRTWEQGGCPRRGDLGLIRVSDRRQESPSGGAESLDSGLTWPCQPCFL
ncbi:MAG: hypothetical protein IH988_09895 [Planctomycetes bacterium]|nr:hypothetical protein [Planctomycetota bacterium]